MKINFRSLRMRLSLLYAVFMMGSMCCLGVSSYWYLGRALASSSQATLEKRQHRILAFINTWPRHDTSLTLTEKLNELSKANAPTDAFEIYDLDGHRIYSSPSPDLYKVGWPGKPCVHPCYAVVHREGHVIRTLNQVVVLDGHKVRLSMAGETDEHFEILTMVRDSYLIFCPILIIASIAGGFVLSHRSLQPVSRIINKARTIGIQDLEHRLPVPQTGDELQVLAETWNDLLGRLETAVSRLTQFTSDISHDLRTTITVMLNTAEFALRRRRPEEEYRKTLLTVVEECHTISRLLEDLLAASRADIVKQKIEWKAVDLSSVTLDVCEHLRARADGKHLSLKTYICDDAWTAGDVFMIRRLITILLDNAIKYTPEGGVIAVSVQTTGDRIQLEVADTGIGIPADSIPRIFDRFYRVDNSRSREDGSSGLGLAIAKWIVEAHQATIDVAARVGHGSTFTVSMPLGPPDRDKEESGQKAVSV